MGAAEEAAVPASAFRPELIVAGVAFFVSGTAGLVYQVAWQRILALHSGVGIYSIAMIVGAFMAGLGIGSYVGGLVSLRVTARQSLRLFALVELGIGAFGALSCWLYYDLLYLKAGWMYSPAWRAGILHFVGLLLPTVLMGMSLPFLVRAMVADAGSAGRTIGMLYGINLLGAAVGSALTPWLLVRFFGIRSAVYAAAAANVAAGVLGLVIGRFLWRAADARAVDAPPPEVTANQRHAFTLWIALYALSGFCALSLEILWFRVLETAVKSTAFTFGTVLALYLLGAAIGCILGALLVSRLQRPLRVFLLLQCVILVYAGVGIWLLANLPPQVPWYGWFYGYWAKEWFGLGRAWDSERFWRLYAMLPGLIFGLPTILMGLSFPTLQRAVQDEVSTSGRKVGILQAANIAGCVAGSLLVGLFALDLLGTTGTFRLLMLVGLVFAGIGIRRFGWRSAFTAFAAALVALAAALPGQRAFWLRLHGTDSASALMDEDASGVGALVQQDSGVWSVLVRGQSISWIPYGGIHTHLGAAPAIMHPAPRDVAIVGLGSGDTAWASACRPETQSLTVFEISGSQPRLLQQLAAREKFAELTRLLADPRLRVRAGDGRNALEQEERLYDVIEADALSPWAAYSGNLYSVEFFRQVLGRLKPGGIVCTWAPTQRVYSTFVEAVPYVVGMPDHSVLFGSNQPIAVDLDAWRARAMSPEVRGYLGDDGAKGTMGLLEQVRPMNVSKSRHPRRQMNWDLFPRDEFITP